MALVALAAVVVATTSCVDGSAPRARPFPQTRLRADRSYLRDAHGRYVFFHGVNASCSTKAPVSIDEKDIATYVGRPFPLATARAELARIRDLGFSAIRLLVIWEAVEPVRRGQYDAAYLSYLREIVKLAGEHGLYVLVDMHQDIFSRHLKVKFNPEPPFGDPGSLEWSLLSLVPYLGRGYTEAVQGDGAPRWAVEACLQEKKMSSTDWGVPRILSGLDQAALEKILKLYQKLTGQAMPAETPDWAAYLTLALLSQRKFAVNESTDMLPFTHWGLAHALSLDVARCYACLFAGDKAFPGLTVDGKNVKDYLQEAYAAAFARVAAEVTDLPNVMGYDLMNEPGGNFLVLAAAAGAIKAGAASGARTVLTTLLGPETGAELFDALITLRLLPPDTTPETLRAWGLDRADVGALLALNNGFDENHLRPFYERVARAILRVDSNALFFIESSGNIALLTGGYGGLGGQWEVPMTHPQGNDLRGRVVFAPHWYPDIYPLPGFNVAPRALAPEQVRYRDYRPQLEQARGLASYSLGNVPVVFGEFGTYFNFSNTLERSAADKKLRYVNRARADGYSVSAHVLDNYYEAFESLFQSNILWCYSTENDERLGDLWNREDFSVLGPDRKPRAELAWARPHARALAGKPIATHFYSDLHYYDPDKGKQLPRREFELRYASKETATPTEIVVPAVQYPDGFYVWLSDGHCSFDASSSTLYHHPANDEPGAEHWVRLRPPLPGQENEGWRYFMRGDRVISR
jgi:hypothetical protein